MDTVLTLLLVRFGLVAAGIVVLALVVFAVALHFRRTGRLDEVRRYATPAVKAAARRLEDRR
jgi:hypothetical protein